MSDLELKSLVIDALKEIQDASGHECPEITGATCPIGGLPGFDSLNGIETTIILAERLHLSLSLKTNVFVDESGRNALNVDEVVARLKTTIQQSENIHAS